MAKEIPMDPELKVPEQQTSGIEYKMFGSGEVFRIDHDDGGKKTLMAKHDGENLIFESANTRRFLPRVAAYLKSSKISYKEIYTKAEGTETEAAQPPPIAPPNTPAPIAPAEVVTENFDPNFQVEGQQPPAEIIPPPPLMNKRDGDKTKAYVEWMKRYKPEEYEERYGIIGQGTVTKFNRVPHPEIPGRYHREPYQKPALLARRKIHLTEKPDQQGDGDFAPIPREDDDE